MTLLDDIKRLRELLKSGTGVPDLVGSVPKLCDELEKSD